MPGVLGASCPIVGYGYLLLHPQLHSLTPGDHEMSEHSPTDLPLAMHCFGVVGNCQEMITAAAHGSGGVPTNWAWHSGDAET